MAATIGRGKSFDVNELLSAASLNQLVRNASINGLSGVDLGSNPQISNGSAPSDAGNGWISAQYEAVKDSNSASLAEYKYVLTSPFGQVALFSPYGFETRRFVHKDGGTLAAGLVELVSTGNNSASLAATYSYATGTPRHDAIGCLQTTCPSGTHGRLIMKGPVGAAVVDAGGAAVRHYGYLLNASTGQLQHSAGVTNTDKVLSISLDHRRTGDAVIPFWMFGSPVWRSA